LTACNLETLHGPQYVEADITRAKAACLGKVTHGAKGKICSAKA